MGGQLDADEEWCEYCLIVESQRRTNVGEMCSNRMIVI